MSAIIVDKAENYIKFSKWFHTLLTQIVLFVENTQNKVFMGNLNLSLKEKVSQVSYYIGIVVESRFKKYVNLQIYIYIW